MQPYTYNGKAQCLGLTVRDQLYPLPLYIVCRPHRFIELIRIPATAHSFRPVVKNRFQFMLGKISGIPLDSLACLASVAAETKWASFKGQLSSGGDSGTAMSKSPVD